MSKYERYTSKELKAMYDELVANPDKMDYIYSVAFTRDFISKEIGKPVSVEKATKVCDEILASGEKVNIVSLTNYLNAKTINER